jgi:hypothetical protein
MADSGADNAKARGDGCGEAEACKGAHKADCDAVLSGERTRRGSIKETYP